MFLWSSFSRRAARAAMGTAEERSPGSRHAHRLVPPQDHPLPAPRGARHAMGFGRRSTDRERRPGPRRRAVHAGGPGPPLELSPERLEQVELPYRPGRPLLDRHGSAAAPDENGLSPRPERPLPYRHGSASSTGERGLSPRPERTLRALIFTPAPYFAGGAERLALSMSEMTRRASSTVALSPFAASQNSLRAARASR